MKQLKSLTLVIIALLALCGSADAFGSRFNDKLQNRPYADLRRWHLGFSVGIHTQDVSFTHNGLVTSDGNSWYMEQPSFSPGFCVNGLFDVRLNECFNLRISPGMYFGNRDITIVDVNSLQSELPTRYRQNVKSAYVVAPIDIKFSGQRYRNCRPYLTGGCMPAFDVSRKSGDYLRFKPVDFYLTVGMGFDFYLPYFKLNPELKFCFGLTDILDHKRSDLADDPQRFEITQSLTKARSNMVVLTFYFE